MDTKKLIGAILVGAGAYLLLKRKLAEDAAGIDLSQIFPNTTSGGGKGSTTTSTQKSSKTSTKAPAYTATDAKTGQLINVDTGQTISTTAAPVAYTSTLSTPAQVQAAMDAAAAALKGPAGPSMIYPNQVGINALPASYTSVSACPAGSRYRSVYIPGTVVAKRMCVDFDAIPTPGSTGTKYSNGTWTYVSGGITHTWVGTNWSPRV